ncbi:MAG: hydroxyphenylacetyl-CoA thioesterase PaaI [Comamonadaceae bacterium]|nr:MAG: hydroxyphenylacetyl-CoA thioesterase PaaI [Comamonadaceae bacterium]
MSKANEAEPASGNPAANPDNPAPEATAEAVRHAMFANDRASQMLGIQVEKIGPGTATLSMTVRADMLNGFAICHGGLMTTLADSAFAFACNSRNDVTVAASITVDFLAAAKEHDVLTAVASEVSLAGSTGLYDVTITDQTGKRVAVFRGRSHRMKGRQVFTPSAGN